MRNKLLGLLLLTLMSCSSSVDIPDIDVEKWKEAEVCSDYRIQGAEILAQNEELLLGLTQVDLKEFLGSAPRHELGSRSEKFYYYPVKENCDTLGNTALQFRFDALGRAKEVMIVLVD